jgi:hypothetical protein
VENNFVESVIARSRTATTKQSKILNRSNMVQNFRSPRRAKALLAMTLISLLILPTISNAQKKKKKNSNDKVTIDTLNAIIARHEWQFPIRTFLDDAIEKSQKSHRPILAFNVDYTADKANMYVRDSLLRNPETMVFLTKNFELALHDYSVDPAPSVGFDSLRNLGSRLDKLEKGYNIVSRPTAVLINTDGSEIERIPNLEKYSGESLIKTIKDYLAGKNTVESLRKEFWSDNNKDFEKHKRYLDRLMTRFDYDSLLYHLHLLATDESYSKTAAAKKEAAAQYAYLRFKQEGNIPVLKDWIGSLDRHSDSAVIVAGLKDILEYYQTRKKIDSISVYYNNIFTFTGKREPDLLNNYAWDLANFSQQWDQALQIVDEAITKDSKNPNYYDTRAFINYSKKEYASAVTDAKNALKYGSEDKTYFKERLDFYEKEKKRILSGGTEPSPSKE